MPSKRDNSRFAPFVPTLELSPRDEELLTSQAQELVLAAVTEYQHYRNDAVDWSKWKEMRRSDTVRVFRERQSVTKNVVDTDGTPMLPEVLVIGNLAGSVEDMMYGAMATTPTAMLAASRCVDDGLSEAKIMATLIAPSVQEPFRHLSAKWFSFSLGSGMFSLRDCSIIESTGMVTVDNRERLGYVLRHSVHFTDVPDLSPFGVQRANIATWAIYRESGAGMVQCFVKSFEDLGGGPWRSLGLKSVCERALALTKYAQCAETKRFSRLLRAGSWEVLSGKRARLPSDSECSVCLTAFSTSILGSSARTCGICRHAACAHCLQKRAVCVADEPAATRVALQQLRVCAACERLALAPSSAQLQRDELAGRAMAALKPPHQMSSSLTDSDVSDSFF